MPTIHSTPSKNNKRPLLLETTNTNCNTPRGFTYHLVLCCCSRKLLVSVLGIFFCVQAHSLFRFHRNLQSAPWPGAVPVNLLKKNTATKNNVDYSTGRTTPRSIKRRNQIIQRMQQAAVVAKTNKVNRKKSVRGIMESKIENHKLKEKANNNGHMQKTNVSIAAELNKIQHPRIQNTKQVDKKLEGSSATKVKSVRGVIVLGMHRSGTSLLSGLLVHGLHYKSPGKLLAAHMDNPYGYYENYHVMKQNNYWLEEQHKSWDMLNMTTSPTNSSIVVGEFSVHRSCSKRPCVVTEMSKSFRNRTYFTNRNAALSHYNNKSNVPWIMKEPRLCFTMNMWRPLLKGGPPAVLLTFRHPLEVARSLRTRNVTRVENLSDGLKLWIWYNRMAIENSKDLCRVITSNDAILQNHTHEISRIGNELVKCGLPPRSLNVTAMNIFLNKEFMHSNATTVTTSAKNSSSALSNSTCWIPSLQTVIKRRKTESDEEEIYKKAMNIFCDLQSGKAFLNDYIWPILL